MWNSFKGFRGVSVIWITYLRLKFKKNLMATTYKAVALKCVCKKSPKGENLVVCIFFVLFPVYECLQGLFSNVMKSRVHILLY